MHTPTQNTGYRHYAFHSTWVMQWASIDVSTV